MEIQKGTQRIFKISVGLGRGRGWVRWLKFLHEWQSDNTFRSWIKYAEREMTYFWTYRVRGDKNIKIFRNCLETWIWSSERSGLKLWKPVTERLLIEEQWKMESWGALSVRGQWGDGQWEELEITEWFKRWKSNSREPLKRKRGQQSVCCIFSWGDFLEKSPS